MSWLTQFIRPKINALTKKRDTPDQLWIKCTECEQMLFHKDFLTRLSVCRHCSFPMRFSGNHRLQTLFDDGHVTFHEVPSVPLDPLGFRDQKRYVDRLKDARQKTGLKDSVTVASGHVLGLPLVVANFHFEFIGGSMGMAAGEALVIGAQAAIAQNAAFLVIPASGGARMQEGMLSLMQMTRSTIAMNLVQEARLPRIILLSNPTTGGVIASFASLGDIILAEPKAIIGFTGKRVIQETLRQTLPTNFQSAEFQYEHGFVDYIVPREKLRSVLGDILTILLHPPRQAMRESIL